MIKTLFTIMLASSPSYDIHLNEPFELPEPHIELTEYLATPKGSIENIRKLITGAGNLNLSTISVFALGNVFSLDYNLNYF